MNRKHTQNPKSLALTDHSRRAFIGNLGKVVISAGAVGLASQAYAGHVRDQKGKSSSPRDGRPSPSNSRRQRARQIRYQAADNQFAIAIPDNQSNGDEDAVPHYAANFTKGLPHNFLGEVDERAYRSLVSAIRNGRPSAFNAIPLGGDRPLVNPQAAFAYTLAGADSHQFSFPAAPAFSSAWAASEIGEVYLHAILRDVPFDSYDNSAQAAFAVNELNKFSDFRGPKTGNQVTTQTLFRGETAGDLVGNYVSQFLLQPVPFGANQIEQRYIVTAQGDDHMLTQADWLNVQRGGNPAVGNAYDPARRYINTARDLGEFVHLDFSYQAYQQAALILLGWGASTSPGNPYTDSRNQEGFGTLGGPDILTLVAQAAVEGLKAAWYQKWAVHRRLRPETFGGRIHFNRLGQTNYPVNGEIMNSAILDEVFRTNGTYFLPMAYPEGSPIHPAYPAGHATMAGACTTMLKAFFDESFVVPSPVKVDPDSVATALTTYEGEALTIGGELNKLANNISLGRDMAGVHWRTDGIEGMLLGEQVAIRMLRDIQLTYNERSVTFSFTGFQGDTITI